MKVTGRYASGVFADTGDVSIQSPDYPNGDELLLEFGSVEAIFGLIETLIDAARIKVEKW